MAEPPRRPAGWEDIVAAPEGQKAEVLAGELTLHPRPRPRHGRAQIALGGSIGAPFDFGEDGPGGWWIVAEPDLYFGPHDIVSPDLVGWRRERLPELPEARPVTVVPDWICEVLSPSSIQRDRVLKADLYLRAGVPHYWLLDIPARILEAFEARQGGWFRLGGWAPPQRAAIPPFDAVEIEVARLFP
ncbi:MAG TPA: Uma2 family endonuclease [Thermoanaerobaculia bacterium]|nr:Uma2 family endonuclease [Thermoanaerobaculia bacterium]